MRAFAFAVLVLLPAIASGQVVINPSGGTGSTNGIKLTIGATGQIQVLRNGTGQLYSPTGTAGATTNSSMTNGVFLAVGSTVTGPANFATVASTGVTLQAWTPISNSVTPQGNSGTGTTVLRATVAARNYDLTITWQYTYPNDFVIVTHSLLIPTGNTATVRLYHVADAYLGGDDYGPSFFSIGPPAIVGGYRPASNIVEAWRYRAGINWTGYFAGLYSCLFNDTNCPVGQVNSVNSAGTFTNYIEPTTVDNSFGIMWNFGAAPGTYVSQNDLTFYSYQPQVSKRFGTTVITAPASTTLTFTVDNVPGALPQTNLGFTDTFPAGLVMANSTVTNSCGGSVTTSAGGAIAAGSTSVKLAGGGFAQGGTRCTVVVNVTSASAGAYVNGTANISGLSVIENQVTDQTLSVVMGSPVVTLDDPGTINAANATAYRVSGTCQDTNGVVTVNVGTLMTTTPCSLNTFSTTLSVASLSDGSGIVVKAAQTNGGTGTDSASTSKDTIAPAMPAITSPAGGSFLNTATPTLTGTGEVGTTVRVFAGPSEICSAVVSPAGTWSCLTAMQADGIYSLTARATDPAGNSGSTSPGRTVTIDTLVPAAPAITNPAAGATVAPNPSVSGTAEALANVLVFEGTTQLCSTPSDASGQWSCPTSLGIGSHSIVARQIDRANNSGPNSGARAFTVASVPTVTLDTPGPVNAANVNSYPVAGACTTAAGTVTVRVGSVTVSSIACTGARFSTTVAANPNADGAALVLSASQTNATGTGTDTRSTVKDTVAPATPTITAPLDMSFSNTTTPTFTGGGEAGSTVRVSRGGIELCSTVVPSSGQWACTSSVLLPGVVTVSAQATDPAANTSGVSPQRSFTIDTQAPPSPIVSTPTTNASVAPQPALTGTAEPFATVSVFEGAALVCSVTADGTGAWTCNTVLGSGPHTVVARQTDRAGNVSLDSSPRSFNVEGLPNVLLNTPTDITGPNAAAYVVTGACTVNAGSVSVSVGLSSTMVPCAGGMFSATMDVRALPDGAMVTVRAAQTTAAGTGADTRVVRKDATAPTGTAVTQPGPNTVTTNATPPLGGTAEPGSTVTVYVNGHVVGTTTANASGVWAFTPPTPIADGTYVVTASARDAAGNEGPQSTGPTFTIDSAAPETPFIVSPENNSTVDDDAPLEVDGVAERRSTVTLYVDGVAVGTATTDADGHFVYLLDPATLGDGAHVLEAEARDAAGNTSPRSAQVHVTVRKVDERFAGKGLISCSSTGGLEWWAVLALLTVARRREVRS